MNPSVISSYYNSMNCILSQLLNPSQSNNYGRVTSFKFLHPVNTPSWIVFKHGRSTLFNLKQYSKFSAPIACSMGKFIYYISVQPSRPRTSMLISSGRSKILMRQSLKVSRFIFKREGQHISLMSENANIFRLVSIRLGAKRC